MKLISKQKKVYYYQPTKFFLEDLERIYSIISEITESINIRNDDFEFENLQDLQKINTADVSNLKIVGNKNGLPQFILFIYSKLIYISAESDEPALLGGIEKVKEIIKTRKRPILLSNTNVIVISIIGLILTSIAGVLLALSVNTVLLIRLLIAASLILDLYAFSQLFFGKNQIILKYSKESPSFWRRNSDKIFVAIIASVCTVILGYIITIVFTPTP